jgi:hypothetical protein
MKKESSNTDFANRHRVVSNDFEIWLDGDSVKIKGNGSCEELSACLEALKAIAPSYRWGHSKIEFVA